MYYDIIGDIHGYAGHLVGLLRRMDYEEFKGVWRHRDRMAIFVGDFIDRGPRQLESVGMSGEWWKPDTHWLSWAIMNSMRSLGGNLTLPILVSFCDRTAARHTEASMSSFLKEAVWGSQMHSDIIQWFYTLPFWLDLPELELFTPAGIRFSWII